ncbi:MAG: glycosyltransferase family 2 protein [Bryobacteraceae bacterium]|nr:glycosyltransferase family 2 protein [Bryobacteraceae bacterium]
MNGAGIAIVTHNSEAHIGICLAAALRWSAEIVVVDNASADRTPEIVRRFPQARFIANPDNRGFAAAANQGIASLVAPAVLLLNPDAELLTSPAPLAEALEDPRCGAAAGRLIDAAGVPQNGFNVRRFPTAWTLAFEALGLNRLWPENPVNRRYRMLRFDPETAAEVEQPAGAFLMLKRDVWSRLGGFDEDFRPVWFEDVDYLRRLAGLGLKTRYVPGAVARHAGGHSVTSLPDGVRQSYWHASLLRYASKHFGPAGRGMVAGAVAAGSLFRMAAGVAGGRSLSPVSTCAKVMKIAGKSLLSSRTPSNRRVAAAAVFGSVKLRNQP